MFCAFSAKITMRNLYILNMSVQLHCTNRLRCVYICMKIKFYFNAPAPLQIQPAANQQNALVVS